MDLKQGLSKREHSCMRAWFTWINKLWFGPVLAKSSVSLLQVYEGSKKTAVSNGFWVHWESRACDLLLSISLNVCLAQKEAWEQQAEKMHREQPSTVVTRMGKPEYTPCSTNLEHGQIQFWKTYQDINIWWIWFTVSSSPCDHACLPCKFAQALTASLYLAWITVQMNFG